jgi:hypothetical protein
MLSHTRIMACFAYNLRFCHFWIQCAINFMIDCQKKYREECIIKLLLIKYGKLQSLDVFVDINGILVRLEQPYINQFTI